MARVQPGDASAQSATPETRLGIGIAGMHCASCVQRVEKALAGVEQVQSVWVNLASERAEIAVRGAPDWAVIRAAVRAAGCSVEPVAQGDDDGAGARANDADMASLRAGIGLAVAATLPIVVLAMGSHFIAPLQTWLSAAVGRQNLFYLYFVLASLVQFGPGLRFYRLGAPALLRGAPDMNSLVMIGTSAAYGYSLVATFVPWLLPPGTVHVYYEAAAMIVTLILIGRYMEARSKGRAGEAIRRLMTLRAKTARVLRDGESAEIALARVQVGELVQVRPGETVPVDGEVLEGGSRVDESMLTGEPAPRQKAAGAEVTGGTINTTGSLVLRATRVGSDTALAQIIRMVDAAQAAKLPIQSLVDRVTAWFVPAVLAAAALTFGVWLLFGPAPALPFALVNAVAVLIIACPCAMGLATPTSVMVGTGRAAEMGVLFRQGEALQRLRGVATIAFDKTGTLTEGRPELTDFVVAEGFERADVLQAVAAVEVHSEHPVADAIVRACRQAPARASSFEATPGHGVSATVASRPVAVGAARFMRRLGVDITPFDQTERRLAEQGKTPLYAAIDGHVAALIAVADPIKPSAPAAIQALHDQGLRTVMVSGDNRAAADAIAGQLGIDEVVADVLPDGKVDSLRRLATTGPLAFVGDGINDAPALAAADVGLAIGTGTDVAVESADVVLMSGDLAGVANAIALSRATINNIKQNLSWAFGYNAALIPLAAGVLYPVFGWLLSPVLAAAAMAFSSVFVLANALRLRRFKPTGHHEAATHEPCVAVAEVAGTRKPT